MLIIGKKKYNASSGIFTACKQYCIALRQYFTGLLRFNVYSETGIKFDYSSKTWQ